MMYVPRRMCVVLLTPVHIARRRIELRENERMTRGDTRGEHEELDGCYVMFRVVSTYFKLWGF